MEAGQWTARLVDVKTCLRDSTTEAPVQPMHFAAEAWTLQGLMDAILTILVGI